MFVNLIPKAIGFTHMYISIHARTQLSKPDGMVLLNNVTRVDPHSSKDVSFSFEVHFKNTKTSPSSPWIFNTTSSVSVFHEWMDYYVSVRTFCSDTNSYACCVFTHVYLKNLTSGCGVVCDVHTCIYTEIVSVCFGFLMEIFAQVCNHYFVITGRTYWVDGGN